MKSLFLLLFIVVCSLSAFTQTNNLQFVKKMIDEAPKSKFGAKRVDYGPCDSGQFHYWIFFKRIDGYVLCRADSASNQILDLKLFPTPDRKSLKVRKRKPRNQFLFKDIIGFNESNWKAVNW